MTAPLVVGIDATASARKPSDLAWGRHRIEQRLRLADDAAIVGQLLGLRPALVAIDAPLAWPAPGTRRSAELALVRLRPPVRCYWTTEHSFIRSLIERWQAIAMELAHHGIPSLEVYPAATRRRLFPAVKGKKETAAATEALRGALSREAWLEPRLLAGANHDALDALLAAHQAQLHLAGTCLDLGDVADGRICVPAACAHRQGVA